MQALDENFRMICNRNIADFSDGEFFIIFLERLIEQRTCGKLDDDSVEDTLAKVCYYWLVFAILKLTSLGLRKQFANVDTEFSGR